MDRSGVFLAAFVLFLLLVECHSAETDGKKTDTDSAVDRKDGNQSDGKLSKNGSDLNTTNVTGEKKESVRNDTSKGLDSDTTSETAKDNGGITTDAGTNGGKEKTGSANEGTGSKHGKQWDVGRDSADSNPSRKDSSEGCDESHSCTDEKKALVACLRVPGNESPDLSLLIQNKGKKPLTVKITAPGTVHLEKNTVQLQEREDKKVKVSPGSSGSDTVIVLTAGNGNCKIYFGDIILPKSGKETEDPPQSSHFSYLFTRASAVYMFIAAVLLVGAAWSCVKFRQRNGPRYQKVEMELPVSKGAKMESDASDGWDNSWGDSWDDEEAPKTPSQPVSNLSSVGLASRRSNNKDGRQSSWKD